MHRWIHSASAELTGATLFETNSAKTIEVGIACMTSVRTSWWHIFFFCSGKNRGPVINDVVVHFVVDWCADLKRSEITSQPFCSRSGHGQSGRQNVKVYRRV